VCNTSSWNRNIAVDVELYELLDVFFESDIFDTKFMSDVAS